LQFHNDVSNCLINWLRFPFGCSALDELKVKMPIRIIRNKIGVDKLQFLLVTVGLKHYLKIVLHKYYINIITLFG
jgi:hypothetical protein